METLSATLKQHLRNGRERWRRKGVQVYDEQIEAERALLEQSGSQKGIGTFALRLQKAAKRICFFISIFLMLNILQTLRARMQNWPG